MGCLKFSFVRVDECRDEGDEWGGVYIMPYMACDLGLDGTGQDGICGGLA